jgi:hypothetical protein
MSSSTHCSRGDFDRTVALLTDDEAKLSMPFRNLSHLSLPTKIGSGATRCRVAVTVLSGSAELLPSSQFSDDHLPEGMNLSSPCALAGVVPRPVPAPLAVPVLLKASAREARLVAALASRSMARPQCSQR